MNVSAGSPRLLLAGESWMTTSHHVKGFDSFTTSTYAEGGTAMIAALRSKGVDVTYQPCHVAATSFPDSAEAMAAFDVIALSDIGANTLLLRDSTFVRSELTTNRLQLLRSFVENGGGLLMIGGYLTFQGIEGKAAYHGTPVEDVLPVVLSPFDDRRENPQGVVPETVDAAHPIVQGIQDWPAMLGYNRAEMRPRRAPGSNHRRRSLDCCQIGEARQKRGLFFRLQRALGAACIHFLGPATPRSGRISSIGSRAKADRRSIAAGNLKSPRQTA